MALPTPADCMEAMLRIVHDAPETPDGKLDPETLRQLEMILEACRDPAKMKELLGGEEESPETEADLDLAEGPVSSPNGTRIYRRR